MGGGNPKSSLLIRFSIVNHPFRGALHLWKPSFTCFRLKLVKVTHISRCLVVSAPNSGISPTKNE